MIKRRKYSKLNDNKKFRIQLKWFLEVDLCLKFQRKMKVENGKLQISYSNNRINSKDTRRKN